MDLESRDQRGEATEDAGLAAVVEMTGVWLWGSCGGKGLGFWVMRSVSGFFDFALRASLRMTEGLGSHFLPGPWRDPGHPSVPGEMQVSPLRSR